MINHEQIKAARAILNLSQKQLAMEAGISIATLNNIERNVQKDPRISTIRAIQDTLESRGIGFTSSHEGIGIFLNTHTRGSEDATLLIVDDSAEDRLLYKTWLGKLSSRKYRVIESDNVDAGYNAFIEHRPDCIVLDFKMQGTDGFQMLAAMKKDRAQLPPVVFVTGLHNDVLRESAERQGVRAYLNKKILTKEGFHEAIERALA